MHYGQLRNTDANAGRSDGISGLPLLSALGDCGSRTGLPQSKKDGYCDNHYDRNALFRLWVILILSGVRLIYVADGFR